MKKILYFISGSIFGVGLIISGMSNPQKVLSFLNIFGNWDPSLMFVMIGAISITAIYFIIIKNKSTKLSIDKKLVVGSFIFGIGWGLVGICPGPAIVILGSANIKGIIFFIALLIGMFLQNKTVK
tara:strand:+ start:146 stop:520 length:375 start_codon:yes stop_codon:yes gene_type:complete